MQTYVFKLADVGEGTAEAEVAALHVKVGDTVAEDQPLVDMMTDKATVEITSPVSGVVSSIHANVGEMAAVGAPLVTFALGGGSEQTSPSASTEEAEARQQPVAAAVVPTTNATFSQQHPTRITDKSADGVIAQRPIASPAVRRRARELRISLKLVRGSGPDGRILHDDLHAHVAEIAIAGSSAQQRKISAVPAVPVAPVERTSGAASPAAHRLTDDSPQEVRIIGLRRKIAEKMVQSKRTIPHFGYVEEIDVTDLEALRAQLNAEGGDRVPKLSPLSFVMRALARVLPDYPNINATYDSDAGILRRHAAMHVGVATQTPGGLMVPVVRHVESLGLWDCAREIARVAAAARNGTAKRDELSGSTITVTSLGTLGGIAATPIINYPETAIIGPNRIVERPVVRGGVIVVRKVMNLSSAFDHRIVDGYEGAEFVQRLKALLELPARLFIDPSP